MRRFVAFGGFSLVVLILVGLATSFAGATKNQTVASGEEAVTVLLKWYHNYFEEGKYQQAEQVAQLAYELAPEDPQTKTALFVARRQQARTPPPVNVERKLEKVLNKLEQLEGHLHELETEKQQLEKQIRVLKVQNSRPSRPPHQEPPGSPDRID